jgi:hypothetical protein
VVDKGAEGFIGKILSVGGKVGRLAWIQPSVSPKVERELGRTPLFLARDAILVTVHLDARAAGEEVPGLVA